MKSLHSRNWIILLVTLAVIVLLIFFNSRGVLGGAKNIFFKISSPFLTFCQNIANGISDFCQSFIKNKDLKKENEKLRAENLELLSGLEKLKELERENEILKEQFGLQDQKSQVLALVRGFDETKTSILINQGGDKGILKDLPVVARGNIIIGKILEVYPDFSKVLLINSEDCQVAATTQDGRVKGILKGMGFKENLNFGMVAREEEMKIGDKIISSGLDNIFPKGFLIGEISEVKKNDLGAFQEAIVRPYIDFDDLEEVFIIKIKD